MRSPDQSSPRRRGPRGRVDRKKDYKPPELVEYGDITELIQADGGSGFDGISGTGGV